MRPNRCVSRKAGRGWRWRESSCRWSGRVMCSDAGEALLIRRRLPLPVGHPFSSHLPSMCGGQRPELRTAWRACQGSWLSGEEDWRVEPGQLPHSPAAEEEEEVEEECGRRWGRSREEEEEIGEEVELGGGGGAGRRRRGGRGKRRRRWHLLIAGVGSNGTTTTTELVPAVGGS